MHNGVLVFRPSAKFFSSSLFLYLLMCCVAVCGVAPVARAQGKDTITFANGDQLTGKLGKVVYGTVNFHSDVLGDLSVPLTKIKTMHTQEAFAAGSKEQHLTKKNVAEQVPVGKIALEDDTLKVMLAEGEVKQFPAKDIGFMLDEPAYRRELHNESDFLYGWNGTVTLGATLVKSTNSAQTYTGAV